MENDTLSSRIFNWVLTHFPPIPLIAGLLLLYIYNDTHLPWALAMCKLSFGLFLIMPGWLLLFSPDTAIALVNAVGFFLSSKSPERLPPKPIINRPNWSELDSFARSILIMLASVSFILGGVLAYKGFTSLEF